MWHADKVITYSTRQNSDCLLCAVKFVPFHCRSVEGVKHRARACRCWQVPIIACDLCTRSRMGCRFVENSLFLPPLTSHSIGICSGDGACMSPHAWFLVVYMVIPSSLSMFFFHQLQIRYLQINFSSCRGCQMFSFRVCFFCICNKPLHPQTLPCVVHTWKLRFQEVALRQVGMQAGARLQTLLHRLEINWKIVWQHGMVATHWYATFHFWTVSTSFNGKNNLFEFNS